MSQMLAAVYYGPGDVRLESRAIPEASAGELIIRVESASICATDIRIVNGAHRKVTAGSMRVPGHEVVGSILSAGEGAGDYAPGERVFIAPNFGCGDCRWCVQGKNNLCARSEAFGITLDGAFAECMRVTRAAVEQGNAIRVPAGVDNESLALAEPLACVLHGIEAVRVSPEDVVMILGAGPIGLMHLLLSHQRGARKVIVSDPAASRLATARELGADQVVDPGSDDLEEIVASATNGEGADVVIVAAGVHAAQEQAIRLAAICGRINLFGGLPKDRPEIRLDANAVHYKELVITGTTACSTEDCRKAVELVCSDAVNLRPLVGARFRLSETLDALEFARGGHGLKAVILPDNQESSIRRAGGDT